MSCTKLDFWKWCFTRMTARSGVFSTSFTSSACIRSQCCLTKSASTFHASQRLGLSTKACSRLPQGSPSGDAAGDPSLCTGSAEGFGVAALVEQAGDAAGLGIDLEANEFVLQRIGGGGTSAWFRRRPELSPAVPAEELVSGRRNVLRQQPNTHPARLPNSIADTSEWQRLPVSVHRD